MALNLLGTTGVVARTDGQSHQLLSSRLKPLERLVPDGALEALRVKPLRDRLGEQSPHSHSSTEGKL